MCFISSFTSERADLPEDEREESVAMAEGYNYIKTLPPRQWVIMLSHTSAFSRLSPLSRAGTAAEQRRCLTSVILLTPRASRCLSRAPSAPPPWLPRSRTVSSWEPAAILSDQSRNVSILTVTLKYPVFSKNCKRTRLTPPEETQRAEANAKSRA